MDLAEAYREQSAALFERWKHKPALGEIDHEKHVFVSDGVVCPEQWFSQEIRPLYLLKEAYGGTEDWSLTDHLLKSGKNCNATWRRITQWTQG